MAWRLGEAGKLWLHPKIVQMTLDYSDINFTLIIYSHTSWAVNTVHNSRPIKNTDFRIDAGPDDAKVTEKVIRVLEELAIDEMILAPMKIQNGEVSGDPERDILKIAVIDRHCSSGRVGKGLVTGFGLKSGAIGSTVCHDNHNPIVVGRSDDEIALCANTILEMGGDFAIVHDHAVAGKLPQ